MADADLSGQIAAGTASRGTRRAHWLTRLVADPGFQRRMAAIPGLRRLVRAEGEAMFDIVAGFCHAQILQALVQLDIPDMLLEHEMTDAALARQCRVPSERMAILLRAGQSLGLLKQRRRSGHFALTTRGAALAGVPGLAGMIRHHDVLYRDLADPVAFFRGEVATELADFWPYVFGAGAASDPATARAYSDLMAESQTLVAQDTLAVLRPGDTRHVMDVGGGTGAFLTALGQAWTAPELTLFDLPAVAPGASDRFVAAGLQARTRIVPGSFRDDPLPAGADMITLVRVLYDHADDTVMALLRAAFDALPVGGRIVISEPMTGGAQRPERAGDAYFAIYCLAMRTGRARSADRVATLLADSGFTRIVRHRSRRPFVTSVVSAVRST